VFTGIVRELGTVVEAEEAGGGRALVVRAPETSARTRVGDSVAVNGCCLTATAVDGDAIAFHAVPETIARTTLGDLARDDAVNVEPPLRAGEELGGHYVQGHVDGVGRIQSVEAEGEGLRVFVEAPNDVLLSLLGVFRYKEKYPNGAPGQRPSAQNAFKFPETGKTLGGKFREYWNTHGGLAQQGYPISGEFTEISDLNGRPYTVQYFERAVFELHPEYQPPFDVLLSQLGRFQYDRKYGRGAAGPPRSSAPSWPARL
jgi:hypothetical protein